MLFKVGNNFINIDCPEKLAPVYYRLKKLTGKVIKKQVHIDFLNRCLKIGFIPQGLRISLPDVGFSDEILENRRYALEKKVIRRLIGFLKKQISRIKEEKLCKVQQLELEGRGKLWDAMRESLMSFEALLHEKEVEKKKLKKERKWGIFKNWGEHRKEAGEKRVVNLSNRVLDTEKEQVLKLGCDFGALRSKNWRRNTMIDVENGLGMMSEEVKNKVRTEVKRHLEKGAEPKMNITPREQKLLKEISTWEDVVVTKADKGGALVVLDRQDYRTKMATMMEGADFKKVDQTEVKRSMRRVDKEVENLVRREVIRKEDRNGWKTTNPVVPVLRGFPKIHKEGVPLRPVVDCRGSATEKSSKKISRLLRDTSVFSPFGLKNSFEFVEKVRSLPAAKTTRIWASLDVVKLFPSIDRTRLWEILERRETEEKIFLGEFMELTRCCVEESYLEWGGEHFKQEKGLPIGSSLSPVLAEVYLSEWEEEFMKGVSECLILWVRYIDDICVCWEGDEESLRDFVMLANSQWEDINFVLELQERGALPFLDVRLNFREDGTVMTSWYQKEIASGILLNQRDAMPRRVSDNMMKNRVASVAKISDVPDEDLVVLERQFRANGHDERRIERCVKAGLEKHAAEVTVNGNAANKENKERKSFVVMDFVGNVSYKIERTLKRAGMEVCYRKGRRLESMLKNGEEKKSQEFSKGLVYKVDCGECDKSYVGETGQPLKIRIDQHKRALKNGDVNNAFFVHYKSTNHAPNWDSVCVLEFEKDVGRRKKIEAWHIQKRKGTLFNMNDGVRMDESWGKDWING